MYIFNVSLLLLTVSYISTSRALPTSCKPDWKIDWNRQYPDLSNFQPFSNPGEILPGVTVNDTLHFVGLLWNAPSWQELVGRVCTQYGPLLFALYPEEQIRRECDLLVTSLQKGQKSDIFGSCTSYWNQIGVENTTKSLISNFDECLQYGMRQDIPSFDGSRCDLDPLVTVYATNLLEKTSRIAFDLLEWLGPSPFSGDWYGACSALRLLLSNSIDQIVDNVKNLLTYPVADTLEYLNLVDICSNNDQTVKELLNLLAIIQNDDEYVCDFLSGIPTREQYLEKGAKLINNVLSVPVDEGICTDVFTFASAFDQYGVIGYQITGHNLTSESNRQQFCREIASALSDSSQFIPTPYSFDFQETSTYDSEYKLNSNPFPSQSDQSFNSFHFESNADPFPSQFNSKSEYFPSQYYPSYTFSVDTVGIGNRFILAEAGQLLPDFSFIEAVNVLGAFLRSDTLSDAGVVFCDVFESFLSEFEPSLQNLCTALRTGDTATVENICLTLSLQSQYYYPSLRIPTAIYMAVTGVDMTRKLFELSAISRDHVCSSLDEYFHSKNNLQSIVRFGLDVYLAELIPIVDKICKDYDSILHFLESETYLDVTEFQEFVRVYSDLVLTHLGYPDRNKFCQTIAAGIDTSSGRAKSTLTRTMQKQVLLFLTDSGRCKELAQTIQRNFVKLSSEMNFMEFLTQYTGYKSIDSACENLSVFFDAGLCEASSGGNVPEFSRLVMTMTVLITYLMYKL